ncbi:hypothetical protein [Photorhabdus caribbeanensis]|uniref:hypothetical protein n=1 Tax=Photorhabdus caribbeanensis TaxID=1004165 RepID=UPI001BD5F3E7|nr:hypothetical protein [Photorhabdus caribbeanensis]
MINYIHEETSTQIMEKINHQATGHWSLVTGHWSLVTGHWSLVTGHWSLVSMTTNNKN